MINEAFGRPRRRRRWLVPLLLVTLLVAAIGFSQAATPSSPLLAEDLRSRAMQMSRRADTFGDMLARMGGVDRVELTTVTGDVQTRIGEIRDYLAGLDAPPELAGVIAVFDLALESWAVGSAGFEEHLLAAADGSATVGLVDQLLDDLLELRAGDRLYRETVEALSAADVTQPVSPMPDVQFLPDAYPLGPGAQTLVAQAAVVGSPLALDPALAIDQVTTVPEWVLDTDDALVVDASETLVVRVVVTNAGNAASEETALGLELVGGDGSVQETNLPVPPLQPSAKTTVTFDPLIVTPGRSYSLVVRLGPAPGEGDTQDNSRTLSFRVNEGTVTTTTVPEDDSG